MQLRKLQYRNVFLFCLILFSLNFFSAKFATNTSSIKSITFTFLLGTIIISLPFIFIKRGGFTLPIKLISLSVLFSVLMAYISWNQEFTYSTNTIPFAIWFSFFLILHIKYPIYTIEKFITFFGFLYVLLFLFQFMHNDKVYFGYRDEFIEDRGIIRVDFPGGGVFFLAFFIALVKSTEKITNRWLYISFILLGLIVTVMQVTRQSILITIIITAFHFLKTGSVSRKIAIITTLTTALGVFFLSNNSISRGLLEQQKETTTEGKNYIRFKASNYFINNFSPNTTSKVFGNGLSNVNSEYGKFVASLADNYGFYGSDLGLIGCYSIFGVFSVVGFLLIFIKGLTSFVPRSQYYLKYYIFFLMCTSLTSDYTFSPNYIITTVLVVYLYQKIYYRLNKSFKESKQTNEIFNSNTSLQS